VCDEPLFEPDCILDAFFGSDIINPHVGYLKGKVLVFFASTEWFPVIAEKHLALQV
jgi:hypothetical protein